MKQKFVGKLKTSHSSASSRTLQPRNQLCYLLFFTMITSPSIPLHHSQRHFKCAGHEPELPACETPWKTPKEELALGNSQSRARPAGPGGLCHRCPDPAWQQLPCPPSSHRSSQLSLLAPGDSVAVHNPERKALQNTQIMRGVSGFPLKRGLYG